MNSQAIRVSVILVVVVVLGLAFLWTSAVDSGPADSYTYSQLMADARAKRVTSIEQRGLRLTVVLDGDASNPRTTTVASESVNVYAEACAQTGATGQPSAGASGGTLRSRLAELDAAERAGLISKEEYERKRAAILDQL